MQCPLGLDTHADVLGLYHSKVAPLRRFNTSTKSRESGGAESNLLLIPHTPGFVRHHRKREYANFRSGNVRTLFLLAADYQIFN